MKAFATTQALARGSCGWSAEDSWRNSISFR